MLLSGKTPKTLFSFHNAQVGQIYHCTSTKAGNASHTSLDGVRHLGGTTYSAIPCSMFRSIPPSRRLPSSANAGLAMAAMER